MRCISHRIGRLKDVDNILVRVCEDGSIDLPEVDMAWLDMLGAMSGQKPLERYLLDFLEIATITTILKHFPVSDLIVAWYVFDVIEASAETVQLVSPKIAEKMRKFLGELRQATTKERYAVSAPIYQERNDRSIMDRLGSGLLSKMDDEPTRRHLRHLIESAKDEIAYVLTVLDRDSLTHHNQRRREFVGSTLYLICQNMMNIEIHLEAMRRLAKMPEPASRWYDSYESLRRDIEDEGVIESHASRRLWLLRMFFDRIEKSAPELLEKA